MKQNTQNGTYITIRIYNIQNSTEAYKTYNHIYNDKKWNQKNMKECDKGKNRISSTLHMIYISTNNVRHPVTKTFTSLHHFLLFRLRHPSIVTTLVTVVRMVASFPT
jgi:hypothetical protein